MTIHVRTLALTWTQQVLNGICRWYYLGVDFPLLIWGDFRLAMLRPNLSSPSARGECDVAPTRHWEDPEGPQMPVT